MRDKIIRIYWNDAMSLADAIRSPLSDVQGLYYITRVFGKKETSLYLGIARYGNTVRRRLEAHRSSWLSAYRGDIRVRIGHILYPRQLDAEEKAEIIDHAESALLYDPAHKALFPENVGKRNSYSYTSLYQVENTGDIFQLQPVIRMQEQR